MGKIKIDDIERVKVCVDTETKLINEYLESFGEEISELKSLEITIMNTRQEVQLRKRNLISSLEQNKKLNDSDQKKQVLESINKKIESQNVQLNKLQQCEEILQECVNDVNKILRECTLINNNGDILNKKIQVLLTKIKESM